MKRSVRIIVFVFAWIGFVCPINAQFTFSVDWDTAGFPVPATVNFGDTVNYTFRIVNTSSTTYAGPVWVIMRVDTVQFLLDSIPFVSIAPFAMHQVSKMDSVHPARYGGGINIVVIWPTAPNVTTTDSVNGTLTVLPVGVAETQRDPLSITVFPVPASNTLFLHRSGGSPAVSETEMTDDQGRVVFRSAGLPSSISLEQFATGMYFVRIRGDSGAETIMKVIRR